MKSKILIIVVLIIASCSRYIALKPEDILSIHPVFKDSSFNRQGGYILKNGDVVKYDKQNLYLKQYLDENKSRINLIEADTNPARLLNLIKMKRVFKPISLPIKVLPFKEFGYIKTKKGEIVFYGSSDSSIADLTGNRVYH